MVASRPTRPGTPDRPGLTAGWLRRRYITEHQSAQHIATETGWSSQYIRDRLRDHHIPLRPAGAPTNLTPIDTATLTGWSAEGLSLAQIATRTGYSRSGVRNLLRRAGLPTRPVAPAASRDDPEVLTEVARLYRDQGRSLDAVGAAFGRGPAWAKARVQAAGLPIHPTGPAATSLDVAQLRRWRIDDGLTIVEIARRAGRPAATIAAALRNAGVPRPPRQPQQPALDPAQLRRLYVDQHRTLAQVATATRASARRVKAALADAGIPLRPARSRADRPPLPTLSADQLTDVYIRQGLTVTEIAAQLGGSTTWVLTALHAHGIPRRTGGARPVPPLNIDTATLTEMYVNRRLDDPAIGAHLAVPPWRVTARRRQLGVRRPPVPPPHPGPPPTPPADVLRRLYLDEHLPTAAIGKLYRISPNVARRWLRDAAIPVQPRTTREHRRTLNVTQLRDLYHQHQWTAAQIAAHLHTTQHLVLRSLHDAGIPVRRGGARPRRRPTEHTQLLAALYNDPEITATLRRHQIPHRPQPGSITSRFPTPIPLTHQTLQALYTDTGLWASPRIVEARS